MKLYLATANRHKAAEFSRILHDAGAAAIVLSGADAGGMPEVEENADSFEGNAALKAEALWRRLGGGEWVVADDSGLEVDALGGKPGVFSARYAGRGATDAANRRKLLDAMRDTPDGRRDARFVCVIALRAPDSEAAVYLRGVCEGEIARGEEGRGGFGYDPVFRPRGYDHTFGTLPPGVKDELSHRGQAVRRLTEYLEGLRKG